MIALPDELAAAIAAPAAPSSGAQEAMSVRVAVRAVLTRGLEVVHPKTIAAEVTYDNADPMPWAGSVVLRAPDDLQLLLPGQVYAPFGTEVDVWADVTLPNGAEYSQQLSRQLVTASRYESQSQTIALRTVDLAQRIERYRFERPFTTPSGDVASVVNAVVENRLGQSPALAPTGVTVGSTTFGTEAERGPWTELLEVTEPRGLRLAYDRRGQLSLAPPAVLEPRPVAPAGFGVSMDQLPPNLIVARGEAQGDSPPAFAIAEDTDPQSPFYVDGPYGRVTGLFASPLLETDADAAAAAATNLRTRSTSAVEYWFDLGFDLSVEGGDHLTVYGQRVEVVATAQKLPDGKKTITGRFLP